MTASLDVARMESELRELTIRAHNDEQLIALLKHQNSTQAREIEAMSTDHAEKVRRLSQERDEAVRVATEVSGILSQAADGIMSGLRKMKGDELPPVHDVERPNLTQISKPTQTTTDDDRAICSILSRLPKVEMSL